MVDLQDYGQIHRGGEEFFAVGGNGDGLH